MLKPKPKRVPSSVAAAWTAESRAPLDSNALAAWMRQDADLQQQFGTITLTLPVHVLQEACYGWILAVQKAEQRRREDLVGVYLDRLVELIEFTRAVTVLPYTSEAQAIYRSLTPGRGSRGRNDLSIAATCLASELPLLTRNVADFSDIPDLQLLTW